MGPPRSSKKRPQANCAHRCVKGISSSIEPQPPAPPRHRDAMSLPLADSVACRLYLPSCDQTHDYSNHNQPDDGDPDIERIDLRDQPRFFGSRREGCCWRWRILCGQSPLGKLQALKSIIVLRIELQLSLVICDCLLVLPHQAISVTALGQSLRIVRLFLQYICIIGNSRVEVFQTPIC